MRAREADGPYFFFAPSETGKASPRPACPPAPLAASCAWRAASFLSSSGVAGLKFLSHFIRMRSSRTWGRGGGGEGRRGGRRGEGGRREGRGEGRASRQQRERDEVEDLLPAEDAAGGVVCAPGEVEGPVAKAAARVEDEAAAGEGSHPPRAGRCDAQAEEAYGTGWQGWLVARAIWLRVAPCGCVSPLTGKASVDQKP